MTWKITNKQIYYACMIINSPTFANDLLHDVQPFTMPCLHVKMNKLYRVAV